jgi:hypothetical protein
VALFHEQWSVGLHVHAVRVTLARRQVRAVGGMFGKSIKVNNWVTTGTSKAVADAVILSQGFVRIPRR